jgi:hypothetical protein
VLVNLAINARDAMPDGGTLRVATETVVVDDAYCREHPEDRPGPCVRVQDRDTGTGMEESVLELISEPFFTTKEVGKGTGLGLAVVYGIVQAHEGWITVQSEWGEGTEFEMFLPALISSDEIKAPDHMKMDGGIPDMGLKERTLVVEDETELRERIEQLLVRQSYRVEAHSTVAGARAAFARE